MWLGRDFILMSNVWLCDWSDVIRFSWSKELGFYRVFCIMEKKYSEESKKVKGMNIMDLIMI